MLLISGTTQVVDGEPSVVPLHRIRMPAGAERGGGGWCSVWTIRGKWQPLHSFLTPEECTVSKEVMRSIGTAGQHSRAAGRERETYHESIVRST